MVLPPDYSQPHNARLSVPQDDFDTPPILCIRVNAEWARYLSGVVSELGNYRRYVTTVEEERLHIARNVQSILAQFTLAEECPPMLTLEYDIIVLQHHTQNNIPGGATVANAWTQLPITQILQDTTGAATLSSNEVTVPGGNWICTASHIFRHATSHSSRIRTTFNLAAFPAALFHNYSDNNRMAVDAGSKPFLKVMIGFPEEFLLRWYYRVSAAQATNGLGVAVNAGVDELYGQIALERAILVES